MDAIAIDHLTYTYPPWREGEPPTPVLRDVTLHVPHGTVLGLIGPAGSGKSTVCLALNGLVPHSTGGVFGGQVLVAGLNTKRERVATLAQKVGVVFQDPETQLFNLTVEDEIIFGLENLGLPLDDIKRRLEWALSITHLETCRDRSPFHLSGGQKQRVALAAVLAMRPEILALDEPTAWLDPLGKTEMIAVLTELKQAGLTMVLVEQDVEVLAHLADRLAVLVEGRVRLEGAPAEIFAHPAEWQALGQQLPQLAELAALYRERQARPYTFYTLPQAIREWTLKDG